MVQLLLVLDDDGGVVRLTLQPDDLGMAAFAIDDNLRGNGFVVLMLLVAGAYTVLQFLYYRTGRVDDLYPSLFCNPVRARRLAVSP